MKKNNDLENNRYGKFYSENSYNLDIMYGREYFKSDINHEIILYKINIIKSKVDDLYGQTSTKNKTYLPPIHIRGLVVIGDVDLSYYGNENSLMREDVGNLAFTTYIDELKELNVDFDRGDIIEYNTDSNRRRFYEVVNANKVIDSTSKSRGSFKPFQKTIVAIPVKEDVTHMFRDI